MLLAVRSVLSRLRQSWDTTNATLFTIIFLWTPPLYRPLSLRCRDDYVAAGVSMLSVVGTPVVPTRRVRVLISVCLAGGPEGP